MKATNRKWFGGTPTLTRLFGRPIAVASIALALAMAGPAATTAAVPAMGRDHVDFEFYAPLFSALCGFDITRHIQGTFSFRSYFDESGNQTMEIDQFQFTDTLSANGKSVSGQTEITITLTFLADGTIHVQSAGVDYVAGFLGDAPSGGGGLLSQLLDQDGNLLVTIVDAGLRTDASAVCVALAP